jgi:hypothetical protein
VLKQNREFLLLQIDPLGVLSLLLSLRVVGNGTMADQFNTLLSKHFHGCVNSSDLLPLWPWFPAFGGTLGLDIVKLCTNASSIHYKYWYIWATSADGQHGFLLDLIQQPEQVGNAN